MTKPAHTPPGPGKGRGPRKLWADWQVRLMQTSYADTPTAELARQLGRTVAQCYAKAAHMGLNKSHTFMTTSASGRLGHFGGRGQGSRFKPGQQPWNKGTNFNAGGRSVLTRFKPGQQPHSTVPIGSYRVTTDGYLERKLSDDPGPYVRRWRGVHLIVWEAAHGPVPDGCVVVFREGRKSTDLQLITTDALESITRRELMRRNSIHTVLPPELASLSHLRGVLNRRINERLKKDRT